MIRDIIIIKDGLPLYDKHMGDDEANIQKLFTENNDLIMMSGFFSALNSFSEEFDNFGPIRELKLSNTDLKLSFLKESTISNVIYLATYDDKSKSVNVERTLRKISRSFIDTYGIENIENWTGKSDYFNGMNEAVEKFIREEIEESETEFKEKVVDLFKNVEEKLNENARIEKDEKNKSEQEVNTHYTHVPAFRSSKKINPRFYITGETSHKVFKKINGEKSINQIADELHLNQEQVYNVCKNLIKIGFVSLNIV